MVQGAFLDQVNIGRRLRFFHAEHLEHERRHQKAAKDIYRGQHAHEAAKQAFGQAGPTMMMAEMALMAAISGVCSAGDGPNLVVADLDRQRENDEVDDRMTDFHYASPLSILAHDLVVAVADDPSFLVDDELKEIRHTAAYKTKVAAGTRVAGFGGC